MTKKVRTFNMSGKVKNTGAGNTITRRLQIGNMKSDKVYAVVDFRVYPSVTNVNSQINGILSYKPGSQDPRNPDFSSTSEIAWSTYNIQQGVPPGLNESLTISESRHHDDERYFVKDLDLKVSDENSSNDINYFVKIAEFATKEDVSSVVQLIQYSELLG